MKIKKQVKRLQSRRDEYDAWIASMPMEQRRGYHRPGSMNPHKGGGKARRNTPQSGAKK